MSYKKTFVSHAKFDKTSSSWKTRNDSQNVAAAMHPPWSASDSESGSQKFGNLALRSRGNSPRPPWKGPCKECYCHEQRITPRLGANPALCVSEPQVQTRCKIHEEMRTTLVNRADTICDHGLLHKAKQVISYRPKSSFLKNLRADAHKSCLCASSRSELEHPDLQLTEARANYENNRPLSCYEKDYEKDLHKYEKDLHKYEKDLHEPKPDSNAVYDQVRGNGGDEATANEDLLAEFRERNFFDCVATGVDENPVQAHKCLHKFTINDRLYPVAVNPDPYGVSRCALCNKSMDRDVQTAKSRGVQTSKLTGSSFSSIAKRYSRDLMPQHLNICNSGKHAVQVQVSKDRIAKELLALQIAPYCCSPCEPINSYALRFQKGVMR